MVQPLFSNFRKKKESKSEKLDAIATREAEYTNSSEFVICPDSTGRFKNAKGQYCKTPEPEVWEE
jgi:hypothetical protein